MPEVPAGIIEIHLKRGRCAVDPVMLLLNGFDRIVYIVIFVNHNLYFRIPVFLLLNDILFTTT